MSKNSPYQFNPKVDELLAKAKKWRQEFEILREIILSCGLSEDVKWGQPCYTHQQGNVVLIHGFKDYCALLFFKGALLDDSEGILVQQTENVQAARQIRFVNAEEILAQKSLLKAYVNNAIAIEKAGLKVDFKKEPEPVPEELQHKFNEIPSLKAAFAALTPGRQRAYILYFAAAKQSKTRISRIEKYLPDILEGRGMDD